MDSTVQVSINIPQDVWDRLYAQQDAGGPSVGQAIVAAIRDALPAGEARPAPGPTPEPEPEQPAQ